jgi:hypothetical protein
VRSLALTSAVAVVLLAALVSCQGGGGGTSAPTPTPTPPGGTISLKFTEYPVDLFGPGSSTHTAKTCDVVQAVINMTPPLAPGERVNVSTAGKGTIPLPTAQIGQTTPPSSNLDMDAGPTGDLLFGFHIMSGSAPGWVEITVTRANGQKSNPLAVHIVP